MEFIEYDTRKTITELEFRTYVYVGKNFDKIRIMYINYIT